MNQYEEIILKDMNINEDSKVYLIVVNPKKESEKINIKRKNCGFNAFELLGMLENTQIDIMKQLSGEIKIDKIERAVVDNE